ncbi:hypothetical protein QP572_05000 [Brevibacterium sp. UMB10442]|nr:hypothetical protein [Brevibacterium sp. UMB10442]
MSQPGPTGTGVGGTQLSTPGVEALNQPGVDCLQMLQVEVPADGVVFQFTEALGDDRSLGFLPSFRVCEPPGPSRGLLTGLLVLVVASLPVLRASYLLPVASSTGGALTDPGLPSPIYSAIVLLIGTLTLCALLFLTAARRRELYLA